MSTQTPAGDFPPYCMMCGSYHYFGYGFCNRNIFNNFDATLNSDVERLIDMVEKLIEIGDELSRYSRNAMIDLDRRGYSQTAQKDIEKYIYPWEGGKAKAETMIKLLKMGLTKS